MIKRINKSKTLTKHISCECKCKFDGRKFSSNLNFNNDNCKLGRKNTMKHHTCKKCYIQSPTSTCTPENGKFLGSLIGDSVTTCDEIIEMAINILASILKFAKQISTKKR